MYNEYFQISYTGYIAVDPLTLSPPTSHPPPPPHLNSIVKHTQSRGQREILKGSDSWRLPSSVFCPVDE